MIDDPFKVIAADILYQRNEQLKRDLYQRNEQLKRDLYQRNEQLKRDLIKKAQEAIDGYVRWSDIYAKENG